MMIERDQTGENRWFVKADDATIIGTIRRMADDDWRTFLFENPEAPMRVHATCEAAVGAFQP